MKKRIAFVHGPLVVGGAEKALINLLHFIDYSRYDVTLWLKDGSGAMQGQLDSRVRIRYWSKLFAQSYLEYMKLSLKKGRLLRVIHSVVCRFLSRAYVRNWHRNFKYYLQSLPPLCDEEYDAAFSFHSLVKEDLMVMDYAIKARKKIGWIHGACRHDPSDPYFESFPIEYKRLDHIFCVSESVRRIFLEKYPSMDNKTSVMYNLQNFDEICRLAEESVDESFDGLTLVTVGRLAKEKGQELIPEAARRLLDKGIHFSWYLVGEGDTRDAIEKRIHTFGVDQTVKLLGIKLNPYPYIKNASLYVQTSYSEGFCVTTFEAKILNTPVVTTDVPGMREQFTEQEAVFCEPTAESLVDGIEKAIEMLPELQKRQCPYTDEFNYLELEKLYRVIGE